MSEIKPLPLSPSKLETEEEKISNHTNRIMALKRGTFIHQMLQYLPSIPKEKQRNVLEKLKPSDVDIPENLLEIFEKPELCPFFGKYSLAEVPVIGVIEGELISGQIDRLAVTKNEVLIIDFKTDRSIPEKIPENYQKQLKA